MYTDYDTDENAPEQAYPMMGVVSTQSGKLNLRKGPSTQSEVIDKISKGEMLTITGAEGSWYSVEYNGMRGYVSSEYISASYEAGEPTYVVTFTVVNKAMLEELTDLLEEKEIFFEVREAAD